MKANAIDIEDSLEDLLGLFTEWSVLQHYQDNELLADSLCTLQCIVRFNNLVSS